MNQLTEVTYSPLSSERSFRVSPGTAQIKVTTSMDQCLEAHTQKEIETLTIKHSRSQDEGDSELLEVLVEYLLGHDPEVKEIKLEGFKDGIPLLGRTFLRSEFFQLRSRWHHEIDLELRPERWTQTNERPHPIRPALVQKTLYKRYLPQLEKTVSFRPLSLNDLDLFHEWHNQPRVSFFWELNQDKEALKAYIEKGLTDAHQIPLVLEMDNEPVGYFEMYWVREDRLGPYYESDAYDRGFHFLIGNKKFLGASITDSIIKSCLHFLFLDDPRTRRVMAEPRHDNQKVLKYAQESVGWKKVKIFDFPHKRAWLLENSRELFFGGNAL